MIKQLALRYTRRERGDEVEAAVASERIKTAKELIVAAENLSEANRKLSESDDELRKVRLLVRGQSEADMVLASVKIILGAAAGKTSNDLAPIYGHQIFAQRQMQSMSQYGFVSLLQYAYPFR